MKKLSDHELLRHYVERRSEAAFTELVRRHLDFVYSAALRMVCDLHLAEDVTQGVFIALAKSAGQLADRSVLSGWLHRAAQNIAAQTVRTDVRRRAREQEAAAMNELHSYAPEASWEQLAPHLDAALGELNEPDRDALLLRYFEKKSAREMAAILSISDEAAQKRVSRAVERLREFFAKHGATVDVRSLGAALSAHALQTAPAGLTVAIAGAAASAGIPIATPATLATLTWINFKTALAVAAAALVAGAGTYLVERRETNRLRVENENLIARQEKLASERNAAAAAATARAEELERLQKNQDDLLRLRAELSALGDQSKELDRLRAEAARLRQLAQSSTTGTQRTNERAIVTKIVFTRNAPAQFLSDDQIRTNISIRPGDLFDPAAVDLDVRNLYGTGFFRNVRVANQNVGEGMVLTYVVEEKPRLTAIHFAGNTRFSESGLTQLLASRIGQPLDERTLFLDSERLQDLYETSGFAGTTVEFKTTVDEKAGEGNVSFKITE